MNGWTIKSIAFFAGEKKSFELIDDIQRKEERKKYKIIVNCGWNWQKQCKYTELTWYFLLNSCSSGFTEVHSAISCILFQALLRLVKHSKCLQIFLFGFFVSIFLWCSHHIQTKLWHVIYTRFRVWMRTMHLIWEAFSKQKKMWKQCKMEKFRFNEINTLAVQFHSILLVNALVVESEIVMRWIWTLSDG